MSKVVPSFFASLRATSDVERDAAAEQAVVAIQKEVEPLLASTEGKGPFFGGSDKLTLAEVCIKSLLVFGCAGYSRSYADIFTRSKLVPSCFACLVLASLSMAWLVLSCLLCWNRLRALSAGRRRLLLMIVSILFLMRRMLRIACGLSLRRSRRRNYVVIRYVIKKPLAGFTMLTPSLVSICYSNGKIR